MFDKKINLTKPIIILHAVLISVSIMCSGCGSGRGKLFNELSEPMYWPQPPLKPRIKYLGQFSTQDDLKKEVNSFEAIGRVIFGRDKIGALLRPFGIFVDNEDRMYVADSAGAVIHVMDLKTRNYFQFRQLGKNESLKSPVAVTKFKNRIYVADSIRAEICVFDLHGKYKNSFGHEILKRPSGMSFNTETRRFYISDTRKHTVFVFDADGNHHDNIGSHGGGKGMFNFPTQVWTKGDRIYVSDTLNYRIQVFDTDKQLVSVIGEHGNRPGYFAHPCGLATDAFGNIYVGDKQFENVQMFDKKGDILMAFGNEGNGPGEFWLPGAIFIDHNNRIFIADSFNKRVQVFQFLGEEIK